MALALHFTKGGQGINRLSALRNREEERIRRERRIAVAQLAGIFDFDRDAGESLDHILADQGRVPTSAAGGEDNAVDATELPRREIEAAEHRGALIRIEP